MGISEKAGSIGRGIRTVENVLNVIAGLMLLFMMFLGAADVIGRYLLNSPITGAMETSQLMMGGMIFLAWAYTLAKKAHVTVDIVFIMYPPRVKATLTFIMMLFTFILFCLIVWQSAAMAIYDWQAGKLVRIILIPLAPFKALVPLGAFFLAIESLIQMIQAVPVIAHGKEG